MKYQEGLKETKDFLKTTPEPQMRELCNKARYGTFDGHDGRFH